MNFFLVLTFLFLAGSVIGWCIELIYRRLASKAHKWVNPGFLVGPYLPLYGFSLTILFLLTYIDVSFIQNIYLQKAVLFVLMALCITFFEYIAGLIFIIGMKIKLWDYSNEWGNIKGIICPKFTFYWYILSAVYYFFIHPRILDWLFWFTNHISFSFVVGFFYGIMAIDVFYSFKVMSKVRAFAKENKTVIRLHNLQLAVREHNEEEKEKISFWLTMKSEKFTVPEQLKKIHDKITGQK